MNWRPVTNDNDILRDGDEFRIWQSDQAWSEWVRVEMSIGLTLREFVYMRDPRNGLLNSKAPQMVEVRRPVTEGDEQ